MEAWLEELVKEAREVLNSGRRILIVVVKPSNMGKMWRKVSHDSRIVVWLSTKKKRCRTVPPSVGMVLHTKFWYHKTKEKIESCVEESELKKRNLQTGQLNMILEELLCSPPLSHSDVVSVFSKTKTQSVPKINLVQTCASAQKEEKMATEENEATEETTVVAEPILHKDSMEFIDEYLEKGVMFRVAVKEIKGDNILLKEKMKVLEEERDRIFKKAKEEGLLFEKRIKELEEERDTAKREFETKLLEFKQRVQELVLGLGV